MAPKPRLPAAPDRLAATPKSRSETPAYRTPLELRSPASQSRSAAVAVLCLGSPEDAFRSPCRHSKRFDQGFGMTKASRLASSGCGATWICVAPASLSGSAARADRQ